jgi:hypothetical protein
MGIIKSKIQSFFSKIDYSVLGKSFQEVFWMTLIALLPLIINIVIASIGTNSFIEPLKTRIIPGEILSYCLSFLAPSLYLLTKTQGTSYKLPYLHIFSIVTLLIYVLIVVLYLIAKNKWVSEINLSTHQFDLYFKLALIFFTTTIIFRIYSVYHGSSLSLWSSTRNRLQQDFNAKFTESLK